MPKVLAWELGVRACQALGGLCGFSVQAECLLPVLLKRKGHWKGQAALGGFGPARQRQRGQQGADVPWQPGCPAERGWHLGSVLPRAGCDSPDGTVAGVGGGAVPAAACEIPWLHSSGSASPARREKRWKDQSVSVALALTAERLQSHVRATCMERAQLLQRWEQLGDDPL